MLFHVKQSSFPMIWAIVSFSSIHAKGIRRSSFPAALAWHSIIRSLENRAIKQSAYWVDTESNAKWLFEQSWSTSIGASALILSKSLISSCCPETLSEDGRWTYHTSDKTAAALSNQTDYAAWMYSNLLHWLFLPVHTKSAEAASICYRHLIDLNSKIHC